MKKNIFALILIGNLLTNVPASGLSVVYNFRIAQITRQPIGHQEKQRLSSLSLLLFNLFQKTKCFNIREDYAGGLVTFNRNFAEKYYIRTDFAVAHTNQKVNHLSTVDAIEPDDILLTVGRNFTFKQRSKITVSGLLGIPTHSVNTLQRVGFGSGLVGIGAQLDGIHKFTKKSDFLWGSRYNYFAERTAFTAAGTAYKFSIGSIAYLLVALQTNSTVSLKHGVEGGYSARWGFGVHATPNNIPNLGLLNYMRNNFYCVYKYTFLTERVAHRLLLNVSYGFDTKPKQYGYNAVMLWGSWGIAF
jgi:hypothetical protein